MTMVGVLVMTMVGVS